MMFVFRRYLHQQQHHHGLRHHHHHHHRLAVVAGRRSFYYCKSYSKPLSSLAVTTTTTTTTGAAATTTTTTTKTTMSSSSSSVRNYFYNNDNDDLTKKRVQPTTTLLSLSLSLSPSSYRQHQQHQQHQQQQRRWLGSTTTSSSKSSSSKSSSSTSKNNKNNNKKKKKKKGQAMKRQTQKQPSTNTNTTTNTNTRTDTTAVSSSSSPSFTVINEGNEETTTTTTTTTPKSMSTTFSSTTRKGGGKQQQHFKLPATNTLDWESNKVDLLSSLSTTSDTRLDQTLKASMYDPKIHLPYAPQQWTTSHYEPATDLSDELMERIGVSGKPITVAEYIRNALTHPLYGYYTSQTTTLTTAQQHDDNDNDDWDNDDDDYNNDTQPPKKTSSKIFGRTGDFITAPEISHVFGHCICVWFMTQFDSGILGKKPSKLQLVELGPGRGTLMADILQLALMTALDDKKSDFGNSIIQVNLIETSLELREQQQLTIEESLKDLNDVVELEFVNNNNNNNNNSSSNNDDDENKKERKGEETSKSKSTTSNNNNNNNKQIIKIVWYDDFTEFQHHRNTNVPILLVAQEFFDALPVHVFQMTTNGWREQLIDVVEAEATETDEESKNDEEDQDQENDNDNNATAVSASESNNENNSSKKKKQIPRLRQVLAPDVTPAVEVLLSGSEYNNQANFPIDSVVEICPEAICLVKDIAKVLEESHGTALIIDYGEDGTSDTLRAFSKHKQVPLTSMPGQVDVTADVDFFALRKSLGASASAAETNTTTNIINAFGPVTQGEFLMSMGASDMVIHKIEQDETTEEQAQRIYDALQFLVMPEHMGQRYKVLALGRKRDGIFAPPGF